MRIALLPIAVDLPILHLKMTTPLYGLSLQQVLASIFSGKGAFMERRNVFKGRTGWLLGLLVMGAALMLFACDQPTGKSADLSKKAPPSLGAISNVDGSDETKKEGQKPAAGAEQAPAQNPAAGQPAQAAPKQ